jgi:hypothetical protein
MSFEFNQTFEKINIEVWKKWKIGRYGQDKALFINRKNPKLKLWVKKEKTKRNIKINKIINNNKQ